jgi:hypothetical protein
MLYPPPQFRLLVVAAGVLLLGLGVREWRAGFPELAERLERFDGEEDDVVAVPPVPAVGGGRARPPVAAAPPPGAAEAPAARDPQPLDLNRAGEEEIARLPGVGPGLARRIVEERGRRGRFESPEALRGVLGLGPKKLAALRPLVTVSE